MKQGIVKPIIIVGAARSGTTMIAGQVLNKHPDIAYWPEPIHIWNYGNVYKKTDILTDKDAKKTIKKYITRSFESYLSKSNGIRFMEKTPANTLRLPFVLSVFPDARILHIIRDGRDVAYSAAQEWQGISGNSLDGIELRKMNKFNRLINTIKKRNDVFSSMYSVRNLLESPFYIYRGVQTIFRQMFHPTFIPWGPRIPGLREYRLRYGLLGGCAIQWEICTRMAKSIGSKLSPSQYYELKYEDFLVNSKEELVRICEFLELELDQKLSQKMLQTLVQRKVNFQNSGGENYSRMQEFEELIGITLKELGYL